MSHFTMLALVDLPQELIIPAGDGDLLATLTVPARAHGIVLMAHPVWFNDHRPLTRALQACGLATLRVDLAGLTRGARALEPALGAERLLAVAEWVRCEPSLKGLPLVYFGIADCAAAALTAAASVPDLVQAVVAYGDRDAALAPLLTWLRVPALVLPTDVPPARQPAWRQALLHRIVAVTPAGGRVHDPVALGQVSRHADEWLSTYVPRTVTRRASATGPQRAATAH